MSEQFELRHVAVVAENVDRLAAFYRDVVGCRPIEPPTAQSGRMVPFRWLGLGEHELHVVGKDEAFARDLGVEINTSLQPHFAVRVSDIRALQQRLDRADVQWIDWGKVGISGLNQMFMLDPEGNLVEFEQY